MLADRVAEGWGGVGVGLVVKRLCIKEMGRGGGKKRERRTQIQRDRENEQ